MPFFPTRPPRAVGAAAAVASIGLLAACSAIRGDGRGSPPARRPAPAFLVRFNEPHDEQQWYTSDFELRDHFMRVAWSPDHATLDGDGLTLSIARRPTRHNPYRAGEYQRIGRYGYGRYEVVMRAAKGSGLVSSFFTHTDSYFGDPHDEIDIEFLGHKTRELSVNFFTDGKTDEPVVVPLSFDAAEAFHLYAFEWTPEAIRWFVDGDLVHTARATERPLPDTSGRIIMNIWSGSPAQYDWHGRPDFDSGAAAQYLCASFRPLRGDGDMCSDFDWR